METKNTLDHLKIGETASVIDMDFEGNERRRMLDLGLISGTRVEALQRSPSGDPVAYWIRGAVIALRSEDSARIIVKRQ